MTQSSYPTTIELKGNELGWLIKLAENHYMGDSFRNYIKEHDLKKLDAFLRLLMGRFHPNNFNAGRSNITWVLTQEVQSSPTSAREVKE